MMRRSWMVLAVVALLAAACSSASETVAEQLIEGNDGVTDVNIDGDEVTVEFDDEEGGGSIVIGGGEVPDGLPIPVPGGGEVMSTLEQAGNYSVMLSYPMNDYDDLASFYAEWVADQGAENVSTTSMSNPRSDSWFGQAKDGEFAISLFEGNDNNGNAAVTVSLNWTVTG